MLRLWATIAILAAAGASQALTLQWQTKWSPSMPMGVGFRKVVDTGTGYIIAGNLDAQYVSILKTDYYGNVLSSNLFEPEAYYQCWVKDVQTDTTGRVYLLTMGHPDGNYGYANVACLDPSTLATKWQKHFTPKPMAVSPYFRGFTMAVRGGVGIEAIFFAHSSGEPNSADDKLEYECWDANGTQLFAGSQDDGDNHNPEDSLAFPAAGGGFAVSGSVNLRGLVYRINDSGGLTMKSINPNNITSAINHIERNGSNLVGAGIYNSGNFNPAGFNIAGNGTQTVTVDNGGQNGVVDMALESGDNYILLAKNDSVSYRLLRYNRVNNTINFLGTFNEPNPNFLTVTSGGRAFVNGGFKMQNIDLGTLSLTANVNRNQTVPLDAVPNGPNSVFMVGGTADTKQGVISTFDVAHRGDTNMYVSGYPARYPIASTVDGTGARFVSTWCFDARSRDNTWIVKFSPTGAVQWIRQVLYQADPNIYPVGIEYSSSDSSLISIGKSQNAIMFAKLNPASGAVSTIRKITAPGYGITARDMAIGQDGNVWVVGTAVSWNSIHSEFVMRLSPVGAVLSTHFAAPQGMNAQTRFVHQLSANRWAIVKGPDGSGDGGRVSYYDNAGVPISDYDFDNTTPVKQIASAKAPNGDLVVGVLRANASEIRRFSGSTGASIMNAALPAYITYMPLAVGASPNGNSYMVAKRLSDDVSELTALTPAGAVAWNEDLVATVDVIAGITTDANNWTYVLGQEDGPTSSNSYLVRFLANGTRSAQRRLSGYPSELSFTPSTAIQVLTYVPVRNRRTQVGITKYTSP